MLKEIKTQMCEITKAVKGGLAQNEAVKMINDKLNEMWEVDENKSEEEETEQYYTCCSNFD